MFALGEVYYNTYLVSLFPEMMIQEDPPMMLMEVVQMSFYLRNEIYAKRQVYSKAPFARTSEVLGSTKW